ncbi:hypothetical protein [Shewanella decolorationis]|uniref:Uncharacterized protein n=1 Tax=Shewanella decolorationis S12 TaxID=1353536 RepID=A0ABP2YZ36_9GAMM|nr:hypothetical protein [Shewanella decolorationis]ESE39630.1 hypothetical protein SHD_3839 [Shewanella decolorationis S12]GLR32843.1 hypothetical protein GCM10007922_24020 [Shewanella decolorationis]
MSIESRIKEYSARLDRLAERLKDEDSSNVNIYRNFLTFVSDNPDHTYYPITKLLTAAKCKDANQALDVANYFSVGRNALLNVTFCYFDFDGTDIRIDRECFIDSLNNNTPPVEDETGYPIDNFEPSRLGFYCNLISE